MTFRILSALGILPRSTGPHYDVVINMPHPTQRDVMARRYKQTAFRLMGVVLAVSAASLAAAGSVPF